MIKLEQIVGKVISGEWGNDDASGIGIPVLRTTNFTNEGIIKYDNVVTRIITKNNIESKYLKKGDIIIEKSGGSEKQPVGRVVYFDGEENKYLFNNFTGVLRNEKQNDYLSKYLFYSLFYGYISGKTLKYQNKTTGLHNLKTEQYIKDFEIKERPLSEQQIIVNNIDKLNGVINKRRQQLSKLDELVKSRFIELFGDPISNPKKWPVGELSEYIQFLTSGSRGWSQYFAESGEYFITIKNVKNCRITLDDVQHIVPPNNAEAKRTRVHEGDLLISITADLGRTGVVTKEIADYGGYINQHLTCIRLNQDAVRPLYVAYYMESEAGKSQFQTKNQSAVKAGLNFNAINSLRLMVPQIEIQDNFISFVEQTDKSKLAIQQSLEQLETLKKSLMQQYFG